jgi:hypothetical protein
MSAQTLISNGSVRVSQVNMVVVSGFKFALVVRRLEHNSSKSLKRRVHVEGVSNDRFRG